MSFIKIGLDFYYCDSIEDVDYAWPEASRVFIKGTESYNGVHYTLTGGALVLKANQDEIKSLHYKQDFLISAENIKTINGNSVLGSGNLIVTGSGASWGDITGTLSAQTDLQTALNGKEPLRGSDDNYVTDAEKVVIGNTSGTNTGDNATNSQYSGLAASKQDALVSGTNIKTINGTTILGSGDITVTGGLAQYQVRRLIRR